MKQRVIRIDHKWHSLRKTLKNQESVEAKMNGVNSLKDYQHPTLSKLTTKSGFMYKKNRVVKTEPSKNISNKRKIKKINQNLE